MRWFHKLKEYVGGRGKGDGVDEHTNREETAAQNKKAYTMVIETTGEGRKVCYDLSQHYTNTIRWVSLEKAEDGTPEVVRVPETNTIVFPYPGVFTAAGKTYSSLSELCVADGPKFRLAKDKYGRKVFRCNERFPCFDRADYLHETRCYRWFFILDNDSLTRVYHSDERPTTYVSEDVWEIERECLWKMERDQFFQWDGETEQ